MIAALALLLGIVVVTTRGAGASGGHSLALFAGTGARRLDGRTGDPGRRAGAGGRGLENGLEVKGNTVELALTLRNGRLQAKSSLIG